MKSRRVVVDGSVEVDRRWLRAHAMRPYNAPPTEREAGRLTCLRSVTTQPAAGRHRTLQPHARPAGRSQLTADCGRIAMRPYNAPSTAQEARWFTRLRSVTTKPEA